MNLPFASNPAILSSPGVTGEGKYNYPADDVVSDQRPREKCGVFAVYNYQGPGNAATIAYLGLLALQHRGQESAGMAYITSQGLQVAKGMGLVSNIFSREELFKINAKNILGHVRYSTTGSSSTSNAQPFLARSFDRKGIALAHNGNLTNTTRLHNKQLLEGQIFHSTSDTEIILSNIFRYRHLGLLRSVKKTMDIIEGAYAVVLMDEKCMIAFRDPGGFRPLVVGKIGKSYIFASETAALQTVGAVFERDIMPGEIVMVDSSGMHAETYKQAERKTLCIFEYVYFSRPDSEIDGKSVHLVRREVGSLLGARVKANLDMVIPSPDSGVSAAIGLAERLKLPLEWAVHRNPYLGRTFIAPSQVEREMAVRLKFNPIKAVVNNKKLAIVDDSLVRGTTARVLASLLQSAGAAEVHLCIASPPYKHPCYYGIDIPAAKELAALHDDPKQLAAGIGVDSITFAEPQDLYRAVGKEEDSYCTACFSGKY